MALYLGDYVQDQEVFDWWAFLQRLAFAGHLAAADMGPSYIAPMQYRTPGWWFSVTLKDGFVIEMFCCRRFGDWPARGALERINLMSHVALAITERSAVRAILDELVAASSVLECIAFVDQDEHGHTYGHLRNNVDQRVIELVHQGDRSSRESR